MEVREMGRSSLSESGLVDLGVGETGSFLCRGTFSLLKGDIDDGA